MTGVYVLINLRTVDLTEPDDVMGGLYRFYKLIKAFLNVLLKISEKIYYFYIPHNAISKFNIIDSKDLADAENSYHATTAQIVDNL